MMSALLIPLSRLPAGRRGIQKVKRHRQSTDWTRTAALLWIRSMWLTSVVLVLLLATTSVDRCLGQHWSYGLYPGGKRDLPHCPDTATSKAERLQRLQRCSRVWGCKDQWPFVPVHRMRDKYLARTT
ncbi:progonadoliberin-1-like [Synchiropus picturatus]